MKTHLIVTLAALVLALGAPGRAAEYQFSADGTAHVRPAAREAAFVGYWYAPGGKYLWHIKTGRTFDNERGTKGTWSIRGDELVAIATNQGNNPSTWICRLTNAGEDIAATWSDPSGNSGKLVLQKTRSRLAEADIVGTWFAPNLKYLWFFRANHKFDNERGGQGVWSIEGDAMIAKATDQGDNPSTWIMRLTSSGGTLAAKWSDPSGGSGQFVLEKR